MIVKGPPSAPNTFTVPAVNDGTAVNDGKTVPPSTTGTICGANGATAPVGAVAMIGSTFVPVRVLLNVIVNGPPLLPVTWAFPLKLKVTPVAVAVAASEIVTEVALGIVAMTALSGIPGPFTGMPTTSAAVDEMLVMVALAF